MPDSLAAIPLNTLRAQARERMWKAVHRLGGHCEEETETLWALLGLIAGGLLAFWMLSELGKVPGLSGPGITSGLAATGAYLGGGMLTGLVLLVLPPALAAIAGYELARRRNRGHVARASAAALADMRDLRRTLLDHETHFAVELETLECLMTYLWMKREGLTGSEGEKAFFSEKMLSRA